VLPSVRGICALISAITTRALSTAARAASHDVPSEHRPWRSGGDSCTSATSSGTAPPVNSAGMSDRNTGTKSARPSATATRASGPTKNDTERSHGDTAGANSGAVPIVCRW
jgi:hypothetical protein